MRKAAFLSVLLAGGLGLAGLVAWTQPEPAAVAYPEGYRQWTHVKSMVIQEGHPLYDAFGGIHHVYANAGALAALKQRRAFPDGAVLVFDLLEAPTEGGALVEGPRKAVAVMEKDAKRFAATGGWGFEAFKGDARERAVTNAATECFACHQEQAAPSYVFSRYRP